MVTQSWVKSVKSMRTQPWGMPVLMIRVSESYLLRWPTWSLQVGKSQIQVHNMESKAM